MVIPSLECPFSGTLTSRSCLDSFLVPFCSLQCHSTKPSLATLIKTRAAPLQLSIPAFFSSQRCTSGVAVFTFSLHELSFIHCSVSCTQNCAWHLTVIHMNEFNIWQKWVTSVVLSCCILSCILTLTNNCWINPRCAYLPFQLHHPHTHTFP